MQRIKTPDWVQDAIFYQIFPDRFASSSAVAKPSRLEPWDATPTLHGFKGGDLVGGRLTGGLGPARDGAVWRVVTGA